MKLGSAMESGKEEMYATTESLSEQVDRSSKCTIKRQAGAVIVIGLVVLATVAGIVLVSIYVGSRLTADTYKTAHQIFRTDDGQIIEEETTVTATEIGVVVPNQAEIIYDYTHGIVVQRFSHPKTKLQSVCYARLINASHAPNRDAGKYTDGQVSLKQISDQNDELKTKWRITGRQLEEDLVSDNVARMCEGTVIYWMEKEVTDGIAKRTTECLNGTLYYIEYLEPTIDPCIYKLYEDVLCFDGIVFEYLYTLYRGLYCDYIFCYCY